MTVLNEVAAFLVAQGVGVLGTTLFIGMLPDLPDACAVVYEYGGVPPEKGFNVPGIKYETPGIQVLTRGIAWDYTGPRNKIETAYRALNAVQATVLSGTKYMMVRAQQSPYLFERDEKNRVKFVCNFLAEKELSA